MKTKTKIKIFVGIILMSIGIIIFALVSYRIDKKMKRCYRTTTAVVTNVDANYDDTPTEYEVTVLFKVDGVEEEYTATTREQYKELDLVPVHFNPENPDDFYVDDLSDTNFSIKIAGITVAFIGAIIIIYTIYPQLKRQIIVIKKIQRRGYYAE